jgi:hypothetical protein
MRWTRWKFRLIGEFWRASVLRAHLHLKVVWWTLTEDSLLLADVVRIRVAEVVQVGVAITLNPYGYEELWRN